MNACDVHTFTKVSSQYPEIAAHEKIVDNFIELLRSDRVCSKKYFNFTVSNDIMCYGRLITHRQNDRYDTVEWRFNNVITT